MFLVGAILDAFLNVVSDDHMSLLFEERLLLLALQHQEVVQSILLQLLRLQLHKYVCKLLLESEVLTPHEEIEMLLHLRILLDLEQNIMTDPVLIVQDAGS